MMCEGPILRGKILYRTHRNLQWRTANNFFKIPQEIPRIRPGSVAYSVEFPDPAFGGTNRGSGYSTEYATESGTEYSTGNAQFPVS